MGKNKSKKKQGIPPTTLTLDSFNAKQRIVVDPPALDYQYPSWRFEKIDTLDFFPFPLDDHNSLRDIFNHLISCENTPIVRLKTEQAGGGRSGSRVLAEYHIEECRTALCPKTLAYLDQYFPDTEFLYRFRMGSTKRLYAVQRDSAFLLLWWDENHHIYNCEHKANGCANSCSRG